MGWLVLAVFSKDISVANWFDQVEEGIFSVLLPPSQFCQPLLLLLPSLPYDDLSTVLHLLFPILLLPLKLFRSELALLWDDSLSITVAIGILLLEEEINRAAVAWLDKSTTHILTLSADSSDLTRK